MAGRACVTGKALSVQQPWAWAIIAGLKDVENRAWPTNHAGALIIQAGLQDDEDGWHFLDGHRFALPVDPPIGGIIGVMMVCYVAVPARLIGVKPASSRRDKLTRPPSVGAGDGGLHAAVPARSPWHPHAGLHGAFHPWHSGLDHRGYASGRRHGRGQDGKDERQTEAAPQIARSHSSQRFSALGRHKPRQEPKILHVSSSSITFLARRIRRLGSTVDEAHGVHHRCLFPTRAQASPPLRAPCRRRARR